MFFSILGCITHTECKVWPMLWCSMICVCLTLSVCVCLLDITMSCAKVAELIEMSFGIWSQDRPRNDVLVWSPDTHTRLTALFPGLPGWAGTRKVKPIWILLKQETVSGSGISWAICKSAARSRQITTPAPHHSVFYRPDALPAAQRTASKHWRALLLMYLAIINSVSFS